MENIIFMTYDRQLNQEFVSIGNYSYMLKQIRDTNRQLVSALGINQTPEQRSACLKMAQGELYKSLVAFQEENKSKVLYPN